MKKLLILAFAFIMLASCTKTDKFHIMGKIVNAPDSVLYFENIGIEDINVLDSVRLTKNGNFSFDGVMPMAPEFYRLRIRNQIINISIDSTETVTINADYKNNMATEYIVEGSENCTKIKELAKLQIDLRHQIEKAPTDSLQFIVNAYKENIKRNYIYKAPGKAYAYFALFQTIGRYLIFDPGVNKDDIKAFAAVATNWDTYYSGTERAKNLHNIAIDGMNNTRYLEARQKNALAISDAEETGLIDIALTDNKGKVCHLTDLKGKAVLLYFNIFNTDQSMERIMMIREIYEKYHNSGFEVYMVSLDDNKHFWKTSTKKLPWINVRAEEGEASSVVQLYNVQNIPSFFLINKANQLVARDVQIKDLENSIKALL